MSQGQHPPVTVEVTRGDMVECTHLVDVAVVDAAGGVVAALGDVDHPVYPRSAIKPLQALPLVETGAAEHYGLTQRELALACASHNGEPEQVGTVSGLLGRLGLDGEALECGSQPPSHRPSAEAMLLAGEPPRAIHNNCSGKHTGMLCHVRHLGEAHAGYIQPGHPAQVRVRQAQEEMIGLSLEGAPRGIDGCGLPQYGMPLRALALGMARMADPARLPAERRAAVELLRNAMAAEPYYVAGNGRFCTQLMEAARGSSVVKTGAEGVYVAMIPAAGLGIAIKARDGAARGRDLLLGHLLRRLGGLDDLAWSQLHELLFPILRNRAGTEVGTIRLAKGWDAAL